MIKRTLNSFRLSFLESYLNIRSSKCRTIHPSFVCIGNNVLYAFNMYATPFVCLYAFGRLIRMNQFNPLAALFHFSIQNIAFVVWNFYLELSRQCNASQKRTQEQLNGEFYHHIAAACVCTLIWAILLCIAFIFICLFQKENSSIMNCEGTKKFTYQISVKTHLQKHRMVFRHLSAYLMCLTAEVM